jgi:uncharacterized protein YcbK (DUF882 family)
MGDIAKNFSRDEFQSRDGAPGYDSIDAETLRILQEIRDHFGRAIVVLSGHRSPAHNKAVGGAVNSQHLYARAVDIAIAGHDPDEVAGYITKAYPSVSVGRYNTFTHFDTRTGGPAYWDMRTEKPPAEVEAKPARKPRADRGTKRRRVAPIRVKTERIAK